MIQAFAEIDYPRGGFLTKLKIKQFLLNYRKEYSEEEIEAVIKRMDTDGDSMLSFEEFSQAFSLTDLPIQENINTEEPLKSINYHKKEKSENGQPPYHKREKSRNDLPEDNNKALIKNKKKEQPIKIEKNPKDILSSLLKIILELEEIIDKEKKQLIICPDFNLQEIFSIFDSNLLSFSTESDFLSGLKYFGVKATKDEVSLLFKHYTEKYNKRINYNQLGRLFLPYLEDNSV